MHCSCHSSCFGIGGTEGHQYHRHQRNFIISERAQCDHHLATVEVLGEEHVSLSVKKKGYMYYEYLGEEHVSLGTICKFMNKIRRKENCTSA